MFFKLEKKLKDQIDAWQSEQGREFLVNGQEFLQYVAEQWELHQEDKEKEKLQRVGRWSVLRSALCSRRNVHALSLQHLHST